MLHDGLMLRVLFDMCTTLWYNMSKLHDLARRLAADGPVKTLPTPRLVQALFNNAYILKTTEALFVWEAPFYPQFYIPRSAFTDRVTVRELDAIRSADGQTVAHQLSLSVGDKSTDQVFAFTNDLKSDAAGPLKGLVKIDFAALDQWFEESIAVYVHPKDPFKRIDILQSTRPIRVLIDDVEVANTTTSLHLYETSLPARYYLPVTAIRPDVLRPSKTKTKCPYKGEASYYHVEINGKLHEDVVWYYPQPTLESIKIEGLACFYNEHVTIELDGKVLERPVNHWTKHKTGVKPPGA